MLEQKQKLKLTWKKDNGIFNIGVLKHGDKFTYSVSPFNSKVLAEISEINWDAFFDFKNKGREAKIYSTEMIVEKNIERLNITEPVLIQKKQSPIWTVLIFAAMVLLGAAVNKILQQLF